MKALLVCSIFLVAMPTGTVTAEELVSGLKPGDLATPFNVLDVTGPAKGRSLCYR